MPWQPLSPHAPAAPIGATPAAALFEQVRHGDPATREACVAAFDAACLAHDDAGALRAATAALLSTLIGFADFRALNRLLPAFVRLEAQRAPGTLALAAGDALRVDAVRLGLPALDHALSHDDPGLRPLRQRVFEALRDDPGRTGADERLLLAKLLVDHDGMRNDVAAFDHVVAMMGPTAHGSEASPLWRGRWWALVMNDAEYWGRAGQARYARAQVQALLARHPLPELALALAGDEMRQALRTDDLARAQRVFQHIEQLRLQVPPPLQPRGLRAQVGLLLRRDDHAVPKRERAGYIELRSAALMGLSRHDEAIAVLQALRPSQRAGQGQVLEAMIAMAEAVRALALQAGDARLRCATALRLCAESGLCRFLAAHPPWAARVAAAGLEDGVCVEFIHAVVRERALPPPEPWREHWPWRLRVQVLGTLAVWRDGVPLAGSGAGGSGGNSGKGRDGSKAQRRPLALLALLAAHPAGLAAGELIDALWPSLDAEAPKASLDMAVARLRKWLDWPDAVRVADGRITLHADWVWSDVAAFEAAVAAGDAARALALYHGPFEGVDMLGSGLAARARQRLAGQLAAVVLQAAAAHRSTGRAGHALALLAQALAVEPASPLLRAAVAG